MSSVPKSTGGGQELICSATKIMVKSLNCHIHSLFTPVFYEMKNGYNSGGYLERDGGRSVFIAKKIANNFKNVKSSTFYDKNKIFFILLNATTVFL